MCLKRRIAIPVILLSVFASVFAAPAAVHEWPAAALRGYGEVSAKGTTADAFSSLEIVCENAEKAGIIHAKFVSDFHALGGVRDETLPVGGVAVPVIAVPEAPNEIDTNVFAKLTPGFRDTTVQYCDKVAPSEITVPLAGGAVDTLSENRISSGWAVRPEGITALSAGY